MKKLVIAIFTALLLCGCEPGTQKVHKSDDGAEIYVRKFTFEGHQYIEFYRPSHFTYDNYTGFVHDPDCWCMADYD
jgi:hypothetical protein